MSWICSGLEVDAAVVSDESVWKETGVVRLGGRSMT